MESQCKQFLVEVVISKQIATVLEFDVTCNWFAVEVVFAIYIASSYMYAIIYISATYEQKLH